MHPHMNTHTHTHTQPSSHTKPVHKIAIAKGIGFEFNRFLTEVGKRKWGTEESQT